MASLHQCFLQEEDVRTVMGERVVATQYSGEMLPDYQEVGETAAGDFEVRPSTSRSREGTPMSDDPRDDSGEAGGVDDCQEAESVSINDEAGNVEDEDDDVILIEVDDVSQTTSLLASLKSLYW